MPWSIARITAREPTVAAAQAPRQRTRAGSTASWRPRWRKPASVAAGGAVLEVELDLLDGAARRARRRSSCRSPCRTRARTAAAARSGRAAHRALARDRRAQLEPRQRADRPAREPHRDPEAAALRRARTRPRRDRTGPPRPPRRAARAARRKRPRSPSQQHEHALVGRRSPTAPAAPPASSEPPFPPWVAGTARAPRLPAAALRGRVVGGAAVRHDHAGTGERLAQRPNGLCDPVAPRRGAITSTTRPSCSVRGTRRVILPPIWPASSPSDSGGQLGRRRGSHHRHRLEDRGLAR